MTADELTTADDVRWIDALRARSSRAVQALHDRVRAGLGAALGGRADVSDADLEAARSAGHSDAEIVEIITHVALNVFTNVLAKSTRIDIDFPKVALGAAA